MFDFTHYLPFPPYHQRSRRGDRRWFLCKEAIGVQALTCLGLAFKAHKAWATVRLNELSTAEAVAGLALVLSWDLAFAIATAFILVVLANPGVVGCLIGASAVFLVAEHALFISVGVYLNPSLVAYTVSHASLVVLKNAPMILGAAGAHTARGLAAAGGVASLIWAIFVGPLRPYLWERGGLFGPRRSSRRQGICYRRWWTRGRGCDCMKGACGSIMTSVGMPLCLLLDVILGWKGCPLRVQGSWGWNGRPRYRVIAADDNDEDDEDDRSRGYHESITVGHEGTPLPVSSLRARRMRWLQALTRGQHGIWGWAWLLTLLCMALAVGNAVRVGWSLRGSRTWRRSQLAYVDYHPIIRIFVRLATEPDAESLSPLFDANAMATARAETADIGSASSRTATPSSNLPNGVREPGGGVFNDGVDGKALNVLMIGLESVRWQDVDLHSSSAATGPTPFLASLCSPGGTNLSSHQEALCPHRIYSPSPNTNKIMWSVHCGVMPYVGVEWIESATLSKTTRSARLIRKGCLPALLGRRGYQSAVMTTTDPEGWFIPPAVGFDMHIKGAQLKAWNDDSGGDNNTFCNRANYLGRDDACLIGGLRTWLASRDRSRPFALTLLTVNTHYPYTRPDRGKATSGDAGGLFGNVQEDGDSSQSHDEKDLPGDAKKLHASYAAAVRDTDLLVRKLVGVLSEEAGLNERTVLVVFGDHGESFGAHPATHIHGGSVYEEQIRVPVIIRPPSGLLPRSAIRHTPDNRPRSLLDVPATVIDILDRVSKGHRRIVYGIGEDGDGQSQRAAKHNLAANVFETTSRGVVSASSVVGTSLLSGTSASSTAHYATAVGGTAHHAAAVGGSHHLAVVEAEKEPSRPLLLTTALFDRTAGACIDFPLKYVHKFGLGDDQLFNISKDPFETLDLFTTTSYVSPSLTLPASLRGCPTILRRWAFTVNRLYVDNIPKARMMRA